MNGWLKKRNLGTSPSLITIQQYKGYTHHLTQSSVNYAERESQSWKRTYCLALFIYHSWNNKILEIGNRTVVAKDKGDSNDRKGSGCVYKRIPQRILVVMELFFTFTVLIQLSWLWYWWYCDITLETRVSQDFTIGENLIKSAQTSLCDFLQLCVNLQLSQNNNPIKNGNVASEILFFSLLKIRTRFNHYQRIFFRQNKYLWEGNICSSTGGL